MKVAASTGAAHRKIIRPNSVKHEENFVGDIVWKKEKCLRCGMFEVYENSDKAL